jgi:hypothetical protein
MLLQKKEMRRNFFSRLRHLQALYTRGKIARGSAEHSEILALEELESFFVKERMDRLYGAQLRLRERAEKTICPPAQSFEAAHSTAQCAPDDQLADEAA